MWADNVGWVVKVDHIDGRLDSCSRLKKDPNIRCRREIRVQGNTGHVFKKPSFVPTGCE
jgi:hypothetical protein